MSAESKTLTLPADLKLSDEQLKIIIGRWATCSSTPDYFRNHLLTDLVELLTPKPWVPKVGDWVCAPRGSGWRGAYQVKSVGASVRGIFPDSGTEDGYGLSALRPATAEEIATAKAKLKAGKLAELGRETAQKLKQIEEEFA